MTFHYHRWVGDSVRTLVRSTRPHRGPHISDQARVIINLSPKKTGIGDLDLVRVLSRIVGIGKVTMTPNQVSLVKQLKIVRERAVEYTLAKVQDVPNLIEVEKAFSALLRDSHILFEMWEEEGLDPPG